MISQIGSIRKTRSFLLEQLKDLTTEQFNQTAEGFNNNIVWNLGHMITVQQGICYKRAGLPTLITDNFWQRFKPGSQPKEIIDDGEIAAIKQLLYSTVDQLETDYNKKVFGNYTTWVTKNGLTLTTIDEALAFLAFHEGLHADVITAIKRAIIRTL